MATARRHHHQHPALLGRRRGGVVRCSTSPAQEFAALASVFRRRLVVGASTAAAAAVGANFGGVTSFLLGLSPELGRSLRLDVLYPVGGFTRCLDSDNGFEFIYPANWVGDQTILYNQVRKAELQRSLDPPPLSNGRLSRPKNTSGPVAAFGPPGSNGELNVSVIVSPVPQDFSIESFGGPKDVGEVVLRRIARTKRNPDISATLIDASLREDGENNVKYYKLEFCVRNHSYWYLYMGWFLGPAAGLGPAQPSWRPPGAAAPHYKYSGGGNNEDYPVGSRQRRRLPLPPRLSSRIPFHAILLNSCIQACNP